MQFRRERVGQRHAHIVVGAAGRERCERQDRQRRNRCGLSGRARPSDAGHQRAGDGQRDDQSRGRGDQLPAPGRRLPARGGIQLLQIGAQVGGVLVAIVPVGTQRLLDDARQPFADPVGGFTARLPFTLEDRRADGGDVAAGEQPTPGRHLVEDAPNENKSLRASIASPCNCSGDM